jgi:starch phosphorylase
MAKIKKFNVIPYLPDNLKPLLKIAYNLWWVWNFEAIELFRRLDVDLWTSVDHNPVMLLGAVSQKTLDEASESESFIAHMNRVEKELDRHLSLKSWFSESQSSHDDAKIAYFSAEFGIHECLPIYSGGLGVLAGDHIKSASELGVPLTAVGLLYRMGYFRQYLNIDGWQQERFPETDFYNIPVTLVKGEDGKPVTIQVEYPGRNVTAQVWEVNVGRILLYLLDTNVDQNNPEDKTITDQLYGGDNEMRIKQEVMLGIGGVRALKALNIDISVFHMNEGHAAFLALERIRIAMNENGLSFDEAAEFVANSNVFTTHTPVPAGNDRFSPELVNKYFSHYYKKLGIDAERFMGLGRENPSDKDETFCMTVLAIKLAAYKNGVSKLHGSVSRNMWRNNWPYLPTSDVPIGHITNGIQTLSWTSDEMMRLLNRYLGPRWIESPTDASIWENIDRIPDSELWRCRERLRERLVGFCRQRLKEQLLNRGISPTEAEKANSVLNPEALTIGFARRFATYKRGTLVLRDLERLEALLHHREMPIQIVFAGKAHPRDNMGKEFIRQIIHLNSQERFRNGIVFLEDYDINIARYLVQGVDIWLNNPIRPKEASGTSGMKVIPNGGLNISVLDGWWDEAYNPEVGWAIGKGEVYDDQNYQDEVESLSLYNILEEEVRRLFYQRGQDNLPREWLRMIKDSMKQMNPVFNTNRMVKDYTENYYVKAHVNHEKFISGDFKVARELTKWKSSMVKKWQGVNIREFTFKEEGDVTVGSRVMVSAEVKVAPLSPDDVKVELYFGTLNQNDEIENGAALPMNMTKELGDGTFRFEGTMLCLKAGQFGFTVRVKPDNINLEREFDPDLKVTWA